MYVIMVYDVNEKRVAKVLRICRKYLRHVQRSVFEGKLTEKQLSDLKEELLPRLELEDSVLIYKTTAPDFLRRDEIGTVMSLTNII